MWFDLDERARRLGIVDTKLAQAGAMFFALIVVKLFPAILRIDVWWFVVLAALCAIKPALTFFGTYEGNDR